MMQKLENDCTDIRVEVAYNGEIMVTYIQPTLVLNDLQKEMRDICKFDQQQPFTMKWIDEEGDPCVISSQDELVEAVQLYELNKDTKITVHVFPSVPYAPGLPCPGEDKAIYRRGARRWRKLYRVNGHIFQAKRFNKRAFCAYCQDRIWGLGRQGFKCNNCKLMVHKKCHKFIKLGCLGHPDYLPYEAINSAHGRWTPSQRAPGEPAEQPSTASQLHRIGTPARRQNRLSANDSLGSSSSSSTKTLKNHINNNNNVQHPGKKPSAAGAVAAGSSGGSSPGQQVDQSNENCRGSESCQYSLADFNLLRVIGRGSYAKVLMVELKKTKRIYAMKVIKKALVTEDEDIEWVQTEKHVFETATNYPFLVGLHSCFQSPSRLFFIIEFVRGGDLMFHMQRQRRLPEEHARFYAAEISLALNFLHERGVIYRDLKLDNVLLDHEGHIKLTDYGMCKEGIRAGDTTSTFCGTPNYIAPEILRGEEYDYSVDWWALGVLLYEMLAGRSPFDIVGAIENPDQNTEDFLFQVILERTIRIPRSISVRAQQVLKGFLNKNPLERLGCQPDSSFVDICSHPFFKMIDWDALEAKQVVPPYKPKIDNDRDLEHFDPHFTNEPVILTPDDSKLIEKIDQSEFDGFEYVNPLLMSLEDFV